MPTTVVNSSDPVASFTERDFEVLMSLIGTTDDGETVEEVAQHQLALDEHFRISTELVSKLAAVLAVMPALAGLRLAVERIVSSRHSLLLSDADDDGADDD
ncbi:MAG: hypothetical protein WCF24_05625 [Acidimicrobiales bacterium]